MALIAASRAEGGLVYITHNESVFDGAKIFVDAQLFEVVQFSLVLQYLTQG